MKKLFRRYQVIIASLFALNLGIGFFLYQSNKVKQKMQNEVLTQRSHFKALSNLKSGLMLESLFPVGDKTNPNSFARCLMGVGQNCTEFNQARTENISSAYFFSKAETQENCSETNCSIAMLATIQSQCSSKSCGDTRIDLTTKHKNLDSTIQTTHLVLAREILAAHWRPKVRDSKLLSKLRSR